jgi:hypothetical protein
MRVSGEGFEEAGEPLSRIAVHVARPRHLLQAALIRSSPTSLRRDKQYIGTKPWRAFVCHPSPYIASAEPELRARRSESNSQQELPYFAERVLPDMPCEPDLVDEIQLVVKIIAGPGHGSLVGEKVPDACQGE